MIFINHHEIVCDQQERLEPWTTYDQIIRSAMNFIKDCPIDPANGLPWYLQYSCFWTDPLRPTIWPDNPAGKFAWAVTTLLKYYPYSGEAIYIEIVRTMLDRLLEYIVPEGNDWAGAPYASAKPGTGVYYGDRADGEYATEPDKVAQVGRALVDFYEISGEEKYLAASQRCADVLLAHLRPGDCDHSPVPFRVNVCSGSVIEEYSAHMISLVNLFDELTRLGIKGYNEASGQVLQWILDYPLQNNIWKGYFEDIRLDPTNDNRDQLTALETARYLLRVRPSQVNWQKVVPALIEWVKENLAAAPFFGADSIHEQKYCYFVMGSHTARYASLCAQWAEISGDAEYAERAKRSLNWASYMAAEDGTVTVGIDKPDYYNQCWFTDGYFDYVPHFIDCMAALPKMAPTKKDHLLSSTTVIKKIEYQPGCIRYTPFDLCGQQKLRICFTPQVVTSGGVVLPRLQEPCNQAEGWYFESKGNVLRIFHHLGEVEILEGNN